MSLPLFGESAFRGMCTELWTRSQKRIRGKWILVLLVYELLIEHLISLIFQVFTNSLLTSWLLTNWRSITYKHNSFYSEDILERKSLFWGNNQLGRENLSQQYQKLYWGAIFFISWLNHFSILAKTETRTKPGSDERKKTKIKV